MKYIITALVVLLVGLSCIYQVANADSAAIDWTSAELSKKESEFTNAISSSFGLCKSVNSIDIVSDMEYVNGATLPYSGCIIEGKDVDMYISPFMDISPENPRNFAIRTKPNGKFYFLKPGAIASIQYAQLIPGTNMYTEWRNTPSQRQLVRTMDIRNAIRADRFDSAGNPIRYVFDDSKPSVDMYTFRNIGSSIIAGPITKDGKVIFWSGNGWLYKTSLETGVLDVKYMTGRNINWQNVPYHSNQIYPVDSAGQYVYLGGKLDMLVDTADCGQYYETVDHMGVPEQVLAEQTNCKMRSFKGMIGATVAGGQSVFGARFEGNMLQFGAYDFSGSEARRLLAEFYPVEMVNETVAKLDYLALGDSFSSGEGDIERDPNTKLKAYREHTDDDGKLSVDGSTDQIRPKEKCHLSTNSYPYHLALGMELGAPATDSSTTHWQSVACSGATSWDVKEQGSEDYKGQNDDTNKPRLEGYDFATLKNTALNEFIPGRQKQIEFVKKYKPKVITLTMGGNDINFGGKMKECVVSQATCGYATEEWRVKLKNEIYGQFDNLSSLYSELREATSGQSKIYVVGYPVYINADPAAKCSAKLLYLNLEEREMIVNSILYLNNIIEAAAKKAGVTYVDVEHAFGNHRLCDDGESHVNAVAGILGYGGNELQESFHPNRKGHVDMTNAIWDFVDGASLLDYATCPDDDQQRATCPDAGIDANDATMPPYFLVGESDRNTIVRYYTLTDGVLMKSVEHNGVKTGESWFEPESKVDATLYSTPTHLGQFVTDQDGNLQADITVPASVPAGYHRLSVTGIASDGRPIEVYQTVLVQGTNSNDVDEDGVPDEYDRCIYGLPVDDMVDVANDMGCSAQSGGVKVLDTDVFTGNNLPRIPTMGALYAADSVGGNPLLQATTEPHFSTDTRARIDQPHTKSTNNTQFIVLVSVFILAIATLILYSRRRKA